MSAVLGIAIGQSTLRAVLRTGETLAWTAETERGSKPLAEALAELLDKAPLRRRWAQPRVVVTIGPHAAHTKRLMGMPPLTDRRALDALVREGAGRFFLQNGVPLATSGVRLDADSTMWATAFERPVLDDLDAACRALGLRLTAVVAAATVLGAALQNSAVVWGDGPVREVLRYEQGQLVTAARTSDEHAAGDTSNVPVAVLGALGPNAWRFAAAYGASRLSAAERMAWRPSQHMSGSPTAAVPRWRLAVAAVALILSLTAALAAPGMTAARAAERSRRELAALAPRYRVVAAAERSSHA